MGSKVYVVMLDGEPQYVTKDFKRVKEDCHNWYKQHCNDWEVQESFTDWLYFHEDIDKKQAWLTYIDERFSDGEWGDYVWYETRLVN